MDVFKRLRLKVFLTIPVIMMILLPVPISKAAEQSGSQAANQGKMAEITNLQTETLQKLFAQEQKIRASEKEQERISKDIAALNTRVEALQQTITAEENAYLQKKEQLKELLQSYQKMGTGSYLEIILQSNSLTDFIRRLNILRDITGNTEKLMQQIQSSKQKQADDQNKLKSELASLKDKQTQFMEILAKETQLKNELENELASLAVEKGDYQKYLTDLQYQWDQLTNDFSKAVTELSHLFAEGNLPPDAFQLTGSFLSINGTITDQSLNKIIAGDPAMPRMVVSFQPGNVEIEIPDRHLVLDGTFVIEKGSALKFQVSKGSFNGIPLEDEAIQELFRTSDLVIDFSSVLRGFKLSSFESKKGYLQASIAL